MKPRDLLGPILSFAVGLGTAGALCSWHETDSMTIADAIDTLKDDLTAEQRKLVAAAVRRQVLAGIRAAKELALANDVAAVEAQRALEQFRESLR